MLFRSQSADLTPSGGHRRHCGRRRSPNEIPETLVRHLSPACRGPFRPAEPKLLAPTRTVDGVVARRPDARNEANYVLVTPTRSRKVLCGYTRARQTNIYSHPERVIVDVQADERRNGEVEEVTNEAE